MTLVRDLAGPGVGPWLIDQLSLWGITALTDIQARAVEAGIAEGQSMIVSGPTSSGKTLVGEIAILAALRAERRAIYLVSHKALADQKYHDFISRFGELAVTPLASIGLNTGDRSEGDVDARVMVATYEKALGLVLGGQLNLSSAVIIADELQIIGEQNRGPEIEALCAVFRQRGVSQFVALTATIENPEDLAGWLECKLVRSYHRDVPLHQEIWYQGRAFRTTFGQPDSVEVEFGALSIVNAVSVVGQLIRSGRGPVLVFTESRREAAQLAAAFGQTRPRVGEGIALAEQLDFFSEPTESSEQLRDNAERRVTFHTADLSPQERQVIELGFSQSKFEVCFATSTLAAGVNFPFRSIVFTKLTYEYGERAGTHISRSDYRNMSGRAGRLGMHADGYAILLPRNNVEHGHVRNLVLPENERLDSRLVSLSLRKSVLMLVASGLASDLKSISEFFQNTFYWYQTLNQNPKLLAKLEEDSVSAVGWLRTNHLIQDTGGVLLITPLGRAAAMSGLLPSTAVQLASMLEGLVPQLVDSFEKWIPGLIYAICASDEFQGERPSRFLPFVSASHDVTCTPETPSILS